MLLFERYFKIYRPSKKVSLPLTRNGFAGKKTRKNAEFVYGSLLANFGPPLYFSPKKSGSSLLTPINLASIEIICSILIFFSPASPTLQAQRNLSIIFQRFFFLSRPSCLFKPIQAREVIFFPCCISLVLKTS